MSYSSKEIEQQLQLREDNKREFKQVEFAGNRPKRPTRNDWANEIAAFANSKGGVLYAGVADDGSVVGMLPEQISKLNTLLGEVCTDTIKPSLRTYIYHEALTDGKLVLIVEVPESEYVHQSPGGYYTRVGDSKRLLGEDERLRLAQQRSQARYLWFDEQPVPNTGFETLEEELWRPLLSTEVTTEIEVALEKLGLLYEDEDKNVYRATVAGVLLCTSHPELYLPSACISATHYRGSNRATGQIDSRDITGPLNHQLASAIEFASKNMQVAALKNPGRIDMPQYSVTVLFEALANAIIHRDYSVRGSKIRLSMFDDRLEIQSPGPLPNNLTVEKIMSRQATRNETLASIMARVRVGEMLGGSHREYIVERRGDGVPIIRHSTRELSGKYPEYHVIDDADVLLVIPAATQSPSPANVSISVWSGNRALPNIDLLIIYPNKNWTRATTDDEGEARVDLHSTEMPLTVFAASPGFAAYVEHGWIPSERALAIPFDTLENGGSAIFTEGAGHLPGLKGRINPVRDRFDRTYLYANNVAVNDGARQPVIFSKGEEVKLTDSNGKVLLARVIEIIGRSSLVEYVES